MELGLNATAKRDKDCIIINEKPKILVTGWNGFGQWTSLSQHITKFTPASVTEISRDEIQNFHVALEWSYNVLILSCKVYVLGYFEDGLDRCTEIRPPDGVEFTECACNDKFILFYNTHCEYVWKYTFGSAEGKWKLLPCFMNTEKNETCESECIRKIVCGFRTSVALSSNGRIFDIPNEINRDGILGKIIDVCCGYEHRIALTDVGNVYTWGCGSRCQLGNGTTEDTEEPTLVEALCGIKIIKISSGGWHCCALSDTGDMYTWGWNDTGQLGIKNEITVDVLSNYALPVLIDLYNENDRIENNIIDVSCGSKHTIVKLDDGSFWGSGCNKHAQLGFGETVESVGHFKKLNIDFEGGTVACGTWTSIVIDETWNK